MSDDRYTFLHANLDVVSRIAEEQDDFSFALPDENVDVPAHLVPLYQDEEDDSILPTNSHPSYPYGNPYRATAASKLSAPFPMAHRSLATTLPNFYLSQLGHPAAQQKWTDMGLDGILPYEAPQEHVTAPSAIQDEPRQGGHAQHTPAGQRAQTGATPVAGGTGATGGSDTAERSRPDTESDSPLRGSRTPSP